ncbi:hypothetical protein LXM50_13365 [Microbacterium sp. Au-Mic1]|uniref:hypothetical protein n=1 Tax=Microbacterium sp. Au-Mic1 TaxID=2906457 RepID=UPI001E4D2D54|nr:hypothetical protein [Microbacterium sp. Au-Mic1]MCE4026962.1 hypothetical protein [Microbacterium sp. Au-Mic1]
MTDWDPLLREIAIQGKLLDDALATRSDESDALPMRAELMSAMDTLHLLGAVLRAVSKQEPRLAVAVAPVAIYRAAEAILDDLQVAMERGPRGSLLDWCDGARRVIEAGIAALPEGAGRVQLLNEELTLRSRVLDAAAELRSQRAAKYLDQARKASEAASDAAGVTGNVSLSEYFASYAKSERMAAEWFRGATIIGIIATAVAVSLLPHPNAGDWAGIVYRLAILGALGALFAYLAKQAGQHRRVANWAKSIEVQLKSFRAFVEGAPEDEHGAIYRAFANRVLGNPPEKAKDSSDDTLPASQVIDLLTTIAKKAP